MGTTKIERRWANTGTKTAPTTGEQDTGWVNNEQVPFEWFNWLQDRVEEKVNEVIEERVNSYYDGATDWQSMIMTGLWSDSWALPSDTANILDSADTSKQFDSLALYFTSDGDPRVLAMDRVAYKVDVFDPRAMTLLSTTADLTLDLPTGGGQTWIPGYMCSDGTSLYATFSDTVTNIVQVQAWDIATWNVKSGWSATGTALAAVAGGSKNAIIIADSTYLAVADRNVTISAASSTAINLLALADGSTSAAEKGAGDAPTGVTATAMAANPYTLASDGTNIYFLVGETSGIGQVHLCTATIANPQVGSGGAGYPLSLAGTPTAEVTTSVVSCKGMIITVNAPNPKAASTIVLRTHNAAAAVLDEIELGENNSSTTLDGDEYLWNETLGVCFDGMDLCVLVQFSNTAVPFSTGIVRIDLSKLSMSVVTFTKSLSDLCSGAYLINSLETIDSDPKSLLFDGRDLWTAWEDAAGNTHSGKLFRLPLALLRS